MRDDVMWPMFAALLCLFAVIFLFKVVFLGWSFYVFHPVLDRRLANQYDMIVFCVLICTLSTYAATGNEAYRQISLVIPIFRVFTLMKQTRRIVFTFLVVLPPYGPVALIMVAIYLMFAVLGVQLFGSAEVVAKVLPQTAFGGFRDSTVTLFQMFTGENWHTVMYTHMRAMNKLSVNTFFVAYMSIVHLLFINLFVGVLVDAFNKIFGNRDILNAALASTRTVRSRLHNLGSMDDQIDQLVKNLKARYIYMWQVQQFSSLMKRHDNELYHTQVRFILTSAHGASLSTSRVDEIFKMEGVTPEDPIDSVTFERILEAANQ
eukprot:GFYU01007480.1.p1 GENE.GFYU01007480.1~~GFYU01007480.1.p1  ORF type:complete len:368 (+),score=96.28 GFYU01007480.1:148-1104(+)